MVMGIRSAFKEVLRNIISWAVNNNANEIKEADYGNPVSVPGGRSNRGLKTSISDSDIEDMGRALHFTVYGATGGKVIQIRTYDVTKDKTNNALYIITDKEDLGEELALIITKESLSR